VVLFENPQKKEEKKKEEVRRLVKLELQCDLSISRVILYAILPLASYKHSAFSALFFIRVV